MYQVPVKAPNVQDHFEIYIFDKINIIYLKSVNNFPYPKHYGIEQQIAIYDNYLAIDNSYIIFGGEKYYLNEYKSTNSESSNSLFHPHEILTFEFETEEEALYFQLKYGY